MLEFEDLWKRSGLIIDKNGRLFLGVVLLVDELLDVVVVVGYGTFDQDCGETVGF